MAYTTFLELAVGNIVRRVLRLIRDVYNSEASNSNMASSTAEEVEEEIEDDEDAIPQKNRTFDLQSYCGTSSITSSSSSASMINLLGDGTPVGGKRTSLDYDRKSFNILFFFNFYRMPV